MKITIGSTVYKIHLTTTEKVTDAFEGSEKVECAGLCDAMKEEIYVSNEFPVESRKKIMFHEITHAMLTEIGSQTNEDENFVDALSKQIYSLVNRNDLKKIQDFISK